MIASAQVAYLARRGADYGVHTGPVDVDMARVRERKRNIVERFRSSSRQHLEETERVDLLMGEATFTGPHEVRVTLNQGGERHLVAEKIFINTGARPRVPSLPGLEEVPCLDSTSIMALAQVPEHLLILGGGYIGVEFSQMFRRFGSRVTIVQRGPQLLTHEAPDVAEAVAEVLRDEGIEILLDAHAQRVSQDDGGRLRMEVKHEDGTRTLTGSHLLVAVGRVPNTDALNPAAAGIETDEQGHIQVNERLETNVEGIWALGDVKGGPAFTHISYDDFRVVRTNLLEGGDATVDERLIPYTVFIDPQLGRVGLTETQARDRGYDVRIARLPMSSVARALEVDRTRGVMKAVVDAETDRILGAAILGIEGGEVMSVLQVAMMGDLPYTVLRDTAFAHPTFSEALNNLFMTLD
jgi:pyruvate/2-oxoglutarate dehydrogenase complex dihydrolipoamide dehydrogenase (E3) component